MLTVRIAFVVFAFIMPAFRYYKLWEQRNSPCFVNIGDVAECKGWLNKEDGGEENGKDDDAVMVIEMRLGRRVIENHKAGVSVSFVKWGGASSRDEVLR
jgi:hypothetical protein